MPKEDLLTIIRKILRTDADLDFLLALDENDLKIVDRMHQGSVRSKGNGWNAEMRGLS